MDSPKLTIGFGVGLAVLGVVGYLGSGANSVTALIPTLFGILLIALGFAAQAEGRRAAAMHAAAALGVLGIIGTVPGLFELPDLLSGDISVERPWAVAVQSIMAIALIVFVALLVRTFIQARRVREAQPA